MSSNYQTHPHHITIQSITTQSITTQSITTQSTQSITTQLLFTKQQIMDDVELKKRKMRSEVLERFINYPLNKKRKMDEFLKEDNEEEKELVKGASTQSETTNNTDDGIDISADIKRTDDGIETSADIKRTDDGIDISSKTLSASERETIWLKRMSLLREAIIERLDDNRVAFEAHVGLLKSCLEQMTSMCDVLRNTISLLEEK